MKLATALWSLPTNNLEAFSKYYLQRTYCTNCGKSDRCYIRKGIPAKGLSLPCEHCECPVDLGR